MTPSRDAVRRHYDRAASRYDERNQLIETHLLAPHRIWLGSEASGRTLELGVGTGLNVAHYRAAQVVGIDLSAAMLARARGKASIGLGLADAAALPFPRGTFDTVTTTLVLSAVPDPLQVLSEVRRVVHPNGRLLAIEKTRSRRLAARLVQQVLGPIWRRAQGGDRLGRDLIADLDAAGFDTTAVWFAAGFMARIDARPV